MKIKRRSFLSTGLATSALGTTALSLGACVKEGGPALLKKPSVIQHLIKGNENFPNSRLPLLFYQGALALPANDPAAAVEGLAHGNDWGNGWRDGIFTYHHYHSTAHECLLVCRGSAKVQLGGEGGIIETIAAGDVIIIPAGIGHKNVGASSDLLIVGAYPPGQEPDMCYGRADERPRADHNIARVPMPTTDPIFGKAGPLLELWRLQS